MQTAAQRKAEKEERKGGECKVGKVNQGNQLKITQEHEWQRFISLFAFVCRAAEKEAR